MKKYFYEASKKQLEKPTEPKYVFCTTAKVIVYAENQREALKLAKAKLNAHYHGTGTLLSEPRLTKVAELPADWSYGYGKDYKSGKTSSIRDLVGKNVIR